MNLVSYSIRTKGAHNFARRLGTVFTRFGFSETPTRRALQAIIDTLRTYDAAPTFFIPAVVLQRHPTLLAEIARCGAEIGVHGYVHNDYRTLGMHEQHEQTRQAIAVFQQVHIPYSGFRNPYLGWNEDSLRVFTTLGFAYESNEAVFHDVVGLDQLSPLLRSGYAKSLTLFQAISCSIYTLRPHFEGTLLRIPTSIPDDEMLFDRLRITSPHEVGAIWSRVMQRVYDLGGLYTLNLHPERGILCQQALDSLLAFARKQSRPVWIARLGDIAQWWKERSQFRLKLLPVGDRQWHVTAHCTDRAALLARHLELEDTMPLQWSAGEVCLSPVPHRSFTITAECCPCIALSPQTEQQVEDFLHEQGYPTVRCPRDTARNYALSLDMPGGFGQTREEQYRERTQLVERIEHLAAPLLHFACWPNGYQAALAVSGDVDSVTVQDFFLRIIEVSLHQT